MKRLKKLIHGVYPQALIVTHGSGIGIEIEIGDKIYVVHKAYNPDPLARFDYEKALAGDICHDICNILLDAADK